MYSFGRCWRALPAVLSVLILTGCASSAVAPPQEPAAEEVTENVIDVSIGPVETKRPKPEDYPVAPFEGDALYQLLVAEVAGYRSRYDVALEKYMAATLETRDPGVAARATRLALYMKRDDAALRTVTIWAEEEPENIDAHRHAADLLMRSGRLEDAIVHMEAVKNLGGLAKFDVFAYRAASLDAVQRKSLLEAINRMMERHPLDEELMFSKAVLLEQSGQLEEALLLADRLLVTSNNVNVIILKMGILNAMKRIDAALSFMAAKVEELPENRRLRLIYARLLFEHEDLESARVQYMSVLEKSPNDGDVLFALALIALEQKNDPEARRYLERMVRWNRRVGEAHYYLGGIAEREGDTASALQEYRQVGNGYEFIPAQARIATLLVNDGRWEEASEHLERLRIQLPERRQQLIILEARLLAERGMEQEVLAFLDSKLADEPDNVELLYFRAMTGQQFNRLDILEQDLRRIIELDPQNADAMNALGYTLTDQTDRHEEALELIQKALDLKPDEAAFIDSMGWVQYRLNNYSEAIVHLRRALSLFQNDEVAAHLGEVLWVSGEKAEASEIWDKALQLAPDSEILKNVIKRFRE
jgi:tetratricopeptide (TPR) repeat protein